MTVKSVSQDWYNNLVTNYGEDYANDFIARYKLEIIPTVGQFRPVKAGALAVESGDAPMDDDEYEDENADNSADTQTQNLSVKPDAYKDWETRQSQYLKELSLQRQQQLADAKAYIEENYRGPSLSEQLFAISQALLTPTRMSGFKGTLANLAPAFSSIAKAQTESNRQRAEALFKLQQQYEKGVMDERGDVLKNELALIKARAATNKPRKVWSDRQGQWIDEDKPIRTDITHIPEGTNIKLTKYTDGTWRLDLPDGTQAVYDDKGNKIGTVPAGGAQ